MASSSQVYYDASNPRLFTTEELARMSPAECAAACEQIDQNIVSVLQKVDENFVACTREITDRILPSVEAYGRSSKQIWDSVKLWKTFFEAAAGIRLAGAEGLQTHEEYDQSTADREADTTAKHDANDEYRDRHMQVSPSDTSSDVSTPNTTVRHSSTTPETVTPAKKVKQANNKRAAEGSRDNRGSAEPSWADEISPFEQLQQDMQKTRIATVNDSAYSASSYSSLQAPAIAPSKVAAAEAAKAQKAYTRLRDLSMDSPEFERPALETMSFQNPRRQDDGHQPKAGASNSYQDYRNHAENPSGFFREGSEAPSTVSRAEGSTFDMSSFDPPSEARPNVPRRRSSGGNVLLQKVLTKNMLLGRDGRIAASTPARRSVKNLQMPEDLPKQWNGLADLSKNTLSSYDSPRKQSPVKSPSKFRRTQGTSKPEGPPPTRTGPAGNIFAQSPESESYAGLQSFGAPTFSVSRARLTKTPAKEAARLITSDALQTAALRGGEMIDAGFDSPALEPPSVIKNWATRGYTTVMPNASPNYGDSPLGSLGKPGSAVRQSDDRSPSLPLAHLQLAEGDSFEAEFDLEPDQPPPQPDFRHLADDEDELVDKAASNEDDWGDSFDGDGSADDGGDGFGDVEVPLAGDYDDSLEASRSLEEETVFGGRRASTAAPPPEAGLPQPGQQGRSSNAFNLKGPQAEDMVTLHGGRLLESQPFEASPLAGRDARYGL